MKRAVVLGLLWLAAPASAQDEPGEFQFEVEGEGEGEGEETEAETETETEAETETETEAEAETETEAEAEAEAARPRILVLREGLTPRELARSVEELLAEVGEVVDSTEYEREARARGLPPASPAAFEQLLPERNVAVVVVLEQTDFLGEPHIWIVYRAPTGPVLLEEEHPLAGDRLLDITTSRIQAEARLAIAAVTRSGAAAALASATGEDAGEEVEPGAAVHVAVAAGFGIGTRSFEVPTAPGIVTLSTTPFPAARLLLRIDVEPRAQGRFTFGGEVRYLTSVGLRTTDRRLDGTNRETASRSQHIDLAAHVRYRFTDSLEAVALTARAGWGFRLFSSEAPVTLPDYGLSGPALLVGLYLPIAGDRLSLELGFALDALLVVGSELDAVGVDPGVGVGGEAAVRIRLTSALYLEAAYRESHAFLGSSRGDVRDVERYATLGALYRP